MNKRKDQKIKVSFFEYPEYKWMSKKEIKMELNKLLEDPDYMDFLYNFSKKMRNLDK